MAPVVVSISVEVLAPEQLSNKGKERFKIRNRKCVAPMVVSIPVEVLDVSGRFCVAGLQVSERDDLRTRIWNMSGCLSVPAHMIIMFPLSECDDVPKMGLTVRRDMFIERHEMLMESEYSLLRPFGALGLNLQGKCCDCCGDSEDERPFRWARKEHDEVGAVTSVDCQWKINLCRSCLLRHYEVDEVGAVTCVFTCVVCPFDKHSTVKLDQLTVADRRWADNLCYFRDMLD